MASSSPPTPYIELYVKILEKDLRASDHLEDVPPGLSPTTAQIYEVLPEEDRVSMWLDVFRSKPHLLLVLHPCDVETFIKDVEDGLDAPAPPGKAGSSSVSKSTSHAASSHTSKTPKSGVPSSSKAGSASGPKSKHTGQSHTFKTPLPIPSVSSSTKATSSSSSKSSKPVLRPTTKNSGTLASVKPSHSKPKKKPPPLPVFTSLNTDEEMDDDSGADQRNSRSESEGAVSTKLWKMTKKDRKRVQTHAVSARKDFALVQATKVDPRAAEEECLSALGKQHTWTKAQRDTNDKLKVCTCL